MSVQYRFLQPSEKYRTNEQLYQIIIPNISVYNSLLCLIILEFINNDRLEIILHWRFLFPPSSIEIEKNSKLPI